MKKQSLFSAAVMLIVFSGTAFSQKNIDFTYRYPAGKPVSYINTQNIHEVLDVQGQSMDVYVTSYLGCNIQSAEGKDGNVNLAVAIDTLAEIIDSPQGMMGGTVSEVKGKTFTVAIRPNGKVSDISGAKGATYMIPGQGPADFSASFADFFPVLPEGKISQGHTWNSVDTIRNESGANTQTTIITSENKFEGFERVNGQNCAKISSVLSGNSMMRNQVQGMDMRTSGNFTGNSTTWFSPEDGYFVKFTSTSKMTGNVEMPNEGYSFPVVLDIVEVTEIRK